MGLFNPFKSERLEIKNISHNKNAWPRETYKSDVFYQYALSNQCLPNRMVSEHYFAYTSYLRTTGEFVGYVQGYLPSPKDALWIQTFLIDKKFLRQGYGSEFYTAVLRIFQNSVALNKVYLTCFESNTCGRYFWEKMNYKKAIETSRYSQIHQRISKILIYEKNIEEGLYKEFIYEQEDIKNIRIQ